MEWTIVATPVGVNVDTPAPRHGCLGDDLTMPGTSTPALPGNDSGTRPLTRTAEPVRQRVPGYGPTLRVEADPSRRLTADTRQAERTQP